MVIKCLKELQIEELQTVLQLHAKVGRKLVEMTGKRAVTCKCLVNLAALITLQTKFVNQTATGLRTRTVELF